MSFIRDLGENSAAGAAGGLISGGLGQLFGGMNARRNWKYKQKEMALAQKYNEKNMQIQNQYAIDAFNRENEYNDPSAVSTRYKQAGINPLAALGGGAASGAGISGSLTVPDSDSPSASGGSDSPSFSPVQTLAEMMNAKNQQMLAKKQQDLLDAQARESNARADAQENENSIFDPLSLCVKPI